MFFLFRQDADKLPECTGPFDSFQAAVIGVDQPSSALVVQFSVEHGWMTIWDLQGERWELVRESVHAYAQQEAGR